MQNTDDSFQNGPPEADRLYRNLFSTPTLKEGQQSTFERYCDQLGCWRSVARSLPRDTDVQAARDAFRLEADQRSVTAEVQR